jgi:hypothetical protein
VTVTSPLETPRSPPAKKLLGSSPIGPNPNNGLGSGAGMSHSKGSCFWVDLSCSGLVVRLPSRWSGLKLPSGLCGLGFRLPSRWSGLKLPSGLCGLVFRLPSGCRGLGVRTRLLALVSPQFNTFIKKPHATTEQSGASALEHKSAVASVFSKVRCSTCNSAATHQLLVLVASKQVAP